MNAAVAQAPTRRLAAVLLADVAGYSRMMERDETATHLRLREVRRTIVDPAVARHGGRPVRSKGDDLLVEFASAVEALSCAVQIQQALATDNGDRAPELRMELRIGINLGDILIDEGGDIAGDGVNIAARLQSLATPGGIMLSRAVREQVRQLKDVPIEDAGELRLKNIARPIRAYRVLLPAQAPQRWRRIGGVLMRRRVWLGVLAAGAPAVLVWALADGRLAAGAPPPLSLALLPARAPENDPAARATAQTLNERLPAIARQALGPAAMVMIAPSAATAVPDMRAIGRQMQTLYVAQLAVAEAGERIAVTATVGEAQSRAQLWSATVAVPRSPGTDLPPALVARLVHGIEAAVQTAEIARLAVTEPTSPLLKLLRAERQLRAGGLDAAGAREVASAFAAAAQAVPKLLPALYGEAEALIDYADRATDADAIRAARARADALSLQAIAGGPAVAQAWQVRALVLLGRSTLPSALEASERAVRLNPYDPDMHGLRGAILAYLGRQEDAVAEFDNAIALAPDALTVGLHLYYRGKALLLLGRYDEAIETNSRALAFAPEWPDFMVLTAAYAMHGNRERAAWARAELLKRNPEFTLAAARRDAERGSETYERQLEQQLIAGLRRAGIPE